MNIKIFFCNIKVFIYFRVKSKKKKNSDIEMVLTYLPTERFKRNVVRSRLDLVGNEFFNMSFNKIFRRKYKEINI